MKSLFANILQTFFASPFLTLITAFPCYFVASSPTLVTLAQKGTEVIDKRKPT
jgi:hypothetical protein